MKVPDWNLLRAFHAAATAGSLSAGARQLGLTQPTLSRQVQALEADLGFALFDRLGRRLILTDAGARLLDRVRAMGDAAESVALTASTQGQEIGGSVCISATDGYAAYILPPILARIRAEAPQLSLRVVADNSLTNLHRGEADIAIRHIAPNRDGLVGQHVLDTEALFYAAPDWLARHGEPRSAADIVRAGLIGFDDIEEMAGYLRGIGIEIQPDDIRLSANSSVAVWEMARQGLGATLMLREIAARMPEMCRLLPDFPPISVPVWLVTHHDLQNSPRIALCRRVLVEALAGL